MYLIQPANDQTLLNRLREGDKAAFADIYNTYFAPLYQHAYNRLQDADAAKDVVQELFTALWEKRESLDINSHLSGYLFTAVRNRALNALASPAFYQPLPQQVEVVGDSNTDHRVRERQLASLIEAEIALLPPKMREAFELSRKSQLSHKLIAAQMKITEQSVRSHVRNALRILRVRLGLLAYVCYLLGHF